MYCEIQTILQLTQTVSQNGTSVFTYPYPSVIYTVYIYIYIYIVGHTLSIWGRVYLDLKLSGFRWSIFDSDEKTGLLKNDKQGIRRKQPSKP